MSSDQPEYRWVFPPERPKRGRIWLIAGLSVLAVAIVAVLLVVLLGQGDEPAPDPVPSSVSPSPSVTATSTPTPTASPTETVPPTAPPTPGDPSLPVFRDKVTPLLDDAATGLGFASDATQEEGVQIADQLLFDAGTLSEAVPPRSIADAWRTRVGDYAATLEQIRTAFEQGADVDIALSSARGALDALRDALG